MRLDRTKKSPEIIKLHNVEKLFAKQAAIDLKSISDRQKTVIERTKAKCYSEFEVDVLYEAFEIDAIDQENVILKTGDVFSGTTLTRVLKDSSHMICVAACVKGFEEIASAASSMIEQYYLDSWGTAIIEAAGRDVIDKIKEGLRSNDMYGTFSWSPGQHNVPIENQLPLFSVLRPDEIDMTLNGSMLMHPQKSETFILGAGDLEPDETRGPCDYCDKQSVCTSAHREG